MYVAIAALLANSFWLGSWPLLSKDLGRLGLGVWVSLAGLALLNGVMSVVSFRFFALSQRVRTAAVWVAAEDPLDSIFCTENSRDCTREQKSLSSRSLTTKGTKVHKAR